MPQKYFSKYFIRSRAEDNLLCCFNIFPPSEMVASCLQTPKRLNFPEQFSTKNTDYFPFIWRIWNVCEYFCKLRLMEKVESSELCDLRLTFILSIYLAIKHLRLLEQVYFWILPAWKKVMWKFRRKCTSKEKNMFLFALK